jgi:hypothetical protein
MDFDANKTLWTHIYLYWFLLAQTIYY